MSQSLGPGGSPGSWPAYAPVPPARGNFFLSPDGRLRPGWRLAIYFVVFFLVSVVLQGALLAIYVLRGGSTDEILAGEMGEPIVLLLLLAINLPTALLPAYLMWRLVDRRPFPEMGFALDARKIFADSSLGLALGAAAIGGIFLLERGLGLVEVRSLGFDPLLFVSFGGLLAGAAAEEIVYRGYAYHTTARVWGVPLATGVSSLLFGLAHSGNASFNSLALFNIVYVGVIFVLQVLATGNLWLPIAFHFSWNFFQGPVFGFPVSGYMFPGATSLELAQGADWFTGGAFGPEGGLVSTLVLTVVLLVTLWQLWRSRRAGRAATIAPA